MRFVPAHGPAPDAFSSQLVTQSAAPLRRTGSCMLLNVVFEPSDEGGFTVHVPALPGCISEGDTLEEARRNIREAIELYLEPTDSPVGRLLINEASWAQCAAVSRVDAAKEAAQVSD